MRYYIFNKTRHDINKYLEKKAKNLVLAKTTFKSLAIASMGGLFFKKNLEYVWWLYYFIRICKQQFMSSWIFFTRLTLYKLHLLNHKEC